MDKTKNTIKIFDKYAQQYQDKYMDVSRYKLSLALFCDSIEKKNARILELACGPGNITKHLLEKRPDFKILGTDLAPKMIELAAINNPTANFRLMDCRDIDQVKEKYDALMCGFCLPYLSKEAAITLLGDAVNILAENGVLYLSTMEDDYTKSGLEGSKNTEDKMFMHYHEAGYLKSALVENGFSIIDLQREIYEGKDGKTTTDLIIIAKR